MWKLQRIAETCELATLPYNRFGNRDCRGSTMKLPTTVEEITREWLTEALGHECPGVEVARSRVIDIIPGTSTKIRFALEYNTAGDGAHLPPTLIVKGGFEEHRSTMRMLYYNEVRAYRDWLPWVTINTPRCYYADSNLDSGGQESIVILEDLKSNGRAFCHAQQPQSYRQVSRRLEDMARFHAETWESPELKSGGSLSWVGSRFEDWARVYTDHYLQPDIWQHYANSPRGAAVSLRFLDHRWMTAALEKIAASHLAEPLCVIHGDTHLGNLYVEADGTPGFFDMQVARAPWHLEVAYHIVCALDMADRPRWEQALLVQYLESLKRFGIAAPDFESAWESYRRSIAYGYFIFLINETRFQTEAINTAYTARYSAAMLQLGTYELMC